MSKQAGATIDRAFAALRQGRPELAERVLLKLLRKTPRHFDALFLLGAVRGQQGRFRDAAALFETAAEIRPNSADAYYNLGLCLAHLESKDRALECYRAALRADPRHLNACNNLAADLLIFNRWDEALAHVTKGLAHHPHDAQLLSTRGVALKEAGRFEEAIDTFRQALRLRPDHSFDYGNLGLALREADRLDEAVSAFARARSIEPHVATHHNHLGIVLCELGQLEEGLASLERAVELDARSAEFRENLGITLLRKGNFPQGWEQYEFRKQVQHAGSSRQIIDAPAWRGEPLAGKSILVQAEQGFGDTLQFVRYLPLMAEDNATVTFAVQPKLVALLRDLSRSICIVPMGETGSSFDFQTTLLSLPQVFGTTLSNVPNDVPYLRAEEERVTRWRERFGVEGFKIGISWQGSPTYQGDNRRSIPLREFAPLAAIAGVRLISLQKGFGAEQIADVAFGARIETPGDDFDEAGAFLDTAAIIMGLDLVVTSDTALAHLAGALARPVHVAIRRVADWRWLLERDDSPWYPTMRLFRQQTAGDWTGVFARIAASIAARIS